MKPSFALSVLLAVTIFGAEVAIAQPFVGGFLGFKASGLKGVIKQTTAGGTGTGNVVDAGKTGFTFGVMGGYQVFPPSIAGGWYKLDLALEASFTSLAYFEAGYNAQFGNGAFAADGLSGGSTRVISFDIMPIHRLNIPKFHLLSPYAGLGMSLNMMSTSDITASNATLTGNGEMKVGLLIFYGTLLRFNDAIQPYLEFRHMVPFGSETQFTQTLQAQGQSASDVFSIQDVPGYFSITGGVRINF